MSSPYIEGIWRFRFNTKNGKAGILAVHPNTLKAAPKGAAFPWRGAGSGRIYRTKELVRLEDIKSFTTKYSNQESTSIPICVIPRSKFPDV